MRTPDMGNIFAVRRGIAAVFSIIVVLALLAITQDLLEARLRNYSFYLSESLLFSTFWWLFIPLGYGQYVLTKQNYPGGTGFRMAVSIVPVLLHLILFPSLVWVLSAMFFEHTFALRHTLNFTLSEHFYKLVLLYTIPVFLHHWLNSRRIPVNNAQNVPGASSPALSNLVVTEGSKRISIQTAEIVSITAESPYICIQLRDRKYLHNDTLKNISSQLDPVTFLRIHKSTIVNIAQVLSYTSRLNGDYDLNLSDGAQLRLSRSYAAGFKSKFATSSR